jgi:N-acetylglucosaminyldiphosphoundecaprenol N-acetyl-beta-D-mannosaminyltransferase
MNFTKILGIKINTFKNRKEVFNIIQDYLKSEIQHYIITANAEIILATQYDEEYFYIINKADLKIPDGSGPQIACAVTGSPTIRVSGADLTADILKLAHEKNKNVAIFLWKDGLSRSWEVYGALDRNFAELQVIIKDIDRNADVTYYNDVIEFNPEILFVALGAPWQEKFIYHNLPKIPSVKIAIGVGGSFDFLTGKIKRAPKFFRLMGIEWLWRGMMQPSRWRRIMNATLVFTYKFCKYFFIYPYLYRPNVACLLYKKVGENFFIFLVEREDDPGHWQLPQGGTDGMSVADAGIKELSEEMNNNKFKVIATYKNLYKYDFSEKKKNGSNRHTGYKGQKQSLIIAEFFGDDNDIEVNFWDHKSWKWSEAEKLADDVNLTRRDAALIYLDKFKQTISNL